MNTILSDLRLAVSKRNKSTLHYSVEAYDNHGIETIEVTVTDTQYRPFSYDVPYVIEDGVITYIKGYGYCYKELEDDNIVMSVLNLLQLTTAQQLTYYRKNPEKQAEYNKLLTFKKTVLHIQPKNLKGFI